MPGAAPFLAAIWAAVLPFPYFFDASAFPEAGAETGPVEWQVTAEPLTPVAHDVFFAVSFAGFTPGSEGELWLPPPLLAELPFPVVALALAASAGAVATESLLCPGAFPEFPGAGEAAGSAAGGLSEFPLPCPFPLPFPLPLPLPAPAGPANPASASTSSATPSVPLHRSLVMPPTPPSSVLLYPPIG